MAMPDATLPRRDAPGGWATVTAAQKLLADAHEILGMAESLWAHGLGEHAMRYALLAAERIELAKLLDPAIATLPAGGE